MGHGIQIRAGALLRGREPRSASSDARNSSGCGVIAGNGRCPWHVQWPQLGPQRCILAAAPANRRRGAEVQDGNLTPAHANSGHHNRLPLPSLPSATRPTLFIGRQAAIGFGGRALGLVCVTAGRQLAGNAAFPPWQCLQQPTLQHSSNCRAPPQSTALRLNGLHQSGRQLWQRQHASDAWPAGVPTRPAKPCPQHASATRSGRGTRTRCGAAKRESFGWQPS